jgi:hypothetical protein
MAPYPDDQEKFDDITATLSNSSDEKSTNTNTGGQQYDLTHMDSAGEYSIGSSQASLQMAQYLDDVESRGEADICSFQDVSLNEQSPAVFSDEDQEVRRARKRYYLLPMLIRYSLPIGGCLLAFVVLMVTIGVTASVVRSQDEKRFMNLPQGQGMTDVGVEGFDSVGGWDDMMQGDEEVGDWHEYTSEGGVEEVGDFGVDSYDDAPVYDDAPSLDDFDTANTYDDGRESMHDDAATGGDEEVGTPLEFETIADDQGQAYNDDGDEEVGTPIEFSSPTDDGQQIDRTELLDDAFDGSSTTDDSVSSSTGTSNGSSGGSLNPKWYSTSHPSYLSLLQFHSSTSSNVSPHHTAALFCNDLGEELCSYSTYCPSGKSGDPYNNGPDGLFNMAKEEWEQWAPVNTHGQGVEWVQVGKIVDADGVYGGRCRTYDDWSGGQDVEASVASEHRRYILCCENQNI